ncbi:MAG: oligoendopeptidase F [Defluviitaleaceae bacterium]|nr:oligoendopeptidase F [Defluviitaleaceae bacterium]
MVERSMIAEKDKWDLTNIFKSVEEWKKCVDEITGALKDFEAFRGKLSEPKGLSKCLELKYELDRKVKLVLLYSSLKSDEDTRIGENQALRGQFMQLMAMYNAAISFIDPELIEIGEDLMKLATEDGLEIYKQYFDDILRGKKHTLDADKEELLAKMSEITSSASNIFGMINNADMVFEDVIDKDGNKHKLTHSSAAVHLKSEDRILRESANTNMLKEYEVRKNTIGQSFIENLKKDRILANIRNYNSSIEMKLSEDNIPLDVYTNLLDTIEANRESLYRLTDIRKKVLEVDELYTYDNMVSLVKDSDSDINYEDAVKTVLESLKPLGEEYCKKAKEGFESRWVDVYENIGKRSGAYSFSVPGVHPYILMNFNDSIHDMFTLTHEMGHAMHSYFTHQTQPQVYSSYTIFLAEIASTVNEAFLYEHLMATTTDPKNRVYLLNERIDNFRNTLFRQVSFAEFEKRAHELAQKGAVTREALNEIFLEINRKEYGPNMKFPENSELGWSRIPHFYRSFYVYQYATGFCASVALVEKIKNEGQLALDAYLNMLKGGSSKYSIDLLKEAGVDLTTKAPIEAAMKNFASLVDELEQELSKI